MDFKIVFYKNSKKVEIVRLFLFDLSKSNRTLAQQTFKGLEKLRNNYYHKEPLSKYLEKNLWELRIRAVMIL